MTVQIENPAACQDADAPWAPVRSQRAELGRFCRTGAAFIVGFLLASFALDGAIGAWLHRTNRRGGLGLEVQMAIERTEKNRNAVRIIFLGDSVARQLFKPNTEPGPEVRFLTTNQAVTMAGQCYLAEGAIGRCPHLTDVYLFYLPMAWRNNMPREFTHDYFCGHFHSAAQVVEVFRVKRDVELSFAHAGRWLWPNIMAANSLSRPAFSMEPDARQETSRAAEAAPLPPDPERLLTELSAAIGPAAPVDPDVGAGQRAVTLSPVSRYYLNKLRTDCRARGIRLHVLPCPVSREKNHWQDVDPQGVYDAPIIEDIPAGQLIDAVHFKNAYVAPARQRMIREYGLDFLKKK